MDFEIKADNDNEQEKVQQIDHDINDYKNLFAEDYCTNIRTDLQSQVAFIERLEEATKNADDLATFVNFCAQEYAALNLFMPKITGITSDTYLFNAVELCTVFAQTITELKEGEVDLGSPYLRAQPAEPKKVQQPFGLMDYVKAL